MGALYIVRSPSAEYETQIPNSVSQSARLLHSRGLSNVRMMNQGEKNLLDDLLEMDQTKSFEEFGSANLYQYAIDWLKLTPAVALNLIAVMRRGKQVPELVEAVKSGKINISAARKTIAVITQDNKEAWLELASTTSVAKLEKAVATACPKEAVKESIRYVTGERLELKLGVSEEFRQTLNALKDLLAQKQKAHVDTEDAILVAMKEMINRHSPIEKAKRAEARSSKIVRRSSEPHSAAKTQVRERIPNSIRHQVSLRDGHQCVFVNQNGQRCAQRRWLDIHHIRAVEFGGSNELENLATLCAHHHRQAHLS